MTPAGYSSRIDGCPDWKDAALPVGGAERPDLRIVLTPEQADLLNGMSGTVTRALTYSKREALLTALCLEALERGERLASIRHPVMFPLTEEQAECVRSTTGFPAHRWFVDADRGPLRYTEAWDAVVDTPVPLGTSLFVTLADPDRAVTAAPPDGDHIVLLNPRGGHVFGTGRHEATRLAVEMLEDLLLPDSDVLDVGTGSGVLAMAALKLGARHVRAFETDPEAVAMARRNVTHNGMDEWIDVTSGELVTGTRSFDLAVVNIITPVIIDLLPALHRSLNPRGIVIASGMPIARVGDVIAAAEATSFAHLGTKTGEKWAATAFRRPG